MKSSNDSVPKLLKKLAGKAKHDMREATIFGCPVKELNRNSLLDLVTYLYNDYESRLEYETERRDRSFRMGL